MPRRDGSIQFVAMAFTASATMSFWGGAIAAFVYKRILKKQPSNEDARRLALSRSTPR
jgi:hypothetical protein